jgi:hypothetical protein
MEMALEAMVPAATRYMMVVPNKFINMTTCVNTLVLGPHVRKAMSCITIASNANTFIHSFINPCIYRLHYA